MTISYDKDIKEAFRPLDRLTPRAPEFMFMGRDVEAGPEGEDIYRYKHINTREYVQLDAGGNAYVSELVEVDGARGVLYRPADAEAQLAHATREL